MSGRWAVGSIAGVTLKDAANRDMRIDVVDGEQLNATVFASSVIALDFSVHTQVAVNSKKGVRFGVHLVHLTIAKYQAIITAINTALLAGTPFNVTLADASGSDKADNINANCVLDFGASNNKIVTRGPLSNVYVKDVLFRFITV